jgi:hypothetical protein
VALDLTGKVKSPAGLKDQGGIQSRGESAVDSEQSKNSRQAPTRKRSFKAGAGSEMNGSILSRGCNPCSCSDASDCFSRQTSSWASDSLTTLWWAPPKQTLKLWAGNYPLACRGGRVSPSGNCPARLGSVCMDVIYFGKTNPQFLLHRVRESILD